MDFRSCSFFFGILVLSAFTLDLNILTFDLLVFLLLIPLDDVPSVVEVPLAGSVEPRVAVVAAPGPLTCVGPDVVLQVVQGGVRLGAAVALVLVLIHVHRLLVCLPGPAA